VGEPRSAPARWVEVGDGVLVRRYDELDLSLGLVLGRDACLVIDTGGDAGQGAEWAAAVRSVTANPWRVLLTHAHFDHSFGTAAFLPCPVLSHPGCRAELVADGETQRTEWVRQYRVEGKPEIADRIAATRLVLPDSMLSGRTELDLGGRTVVLDSFGLGHTDHDVVAHVPDADVVFVGDLVENGAPPAFDGSYPATWPAALSSVLDLTGPATTVVPGHGDPVDRSFVAAQRADIVAVGILCAAVLTGDIGEDDALRRSPFPGDTTRAALRALAERDRKP